jgi:hypothetical protein
MIATRIQLQAAAPIEIRKGGRERRVHPRGAVASRGGPPTQHRPSTFSLPPLDFGRNPLRS